MATLASYLGWGAEIRDGTVLQKDFSLMAVLFVRGPDARGLTKEMLVQHRALAGRAIQTLDEGWSAQFYQWRCRVDIGEPREFRDHRAAQIIENESHAGAQQSPHFEIRNYVVLTYLPPDERTRRIGRRFVTEETPLDNKDVWAKEVEAFEARVEQVSAGLETCMLEVKRLRHESLLSFLASSVSTKNVELRMPESPVFLDTMLSSESLVGGLRPRLGEEFIKIVSIKSWPHATVPELLGELEEQPFEYRWCGNYRPLDDAAFKRRLNAERRHHYNRSKSLLTYLAEAIGRYESPREDPDAIAQADAINDVMVILGDKVCTFGFFNLTIMVWDSDEEIALEKAKAVRKICDSLGLVSVLETLNAVDALFGQIPGNLRANSRRAVVSSLSAMDMCSLSTVWSGPTWNEHLNSPPLVLTKTAGSTAFRLCLTVRGVMNCLVLGPVGSGKTFLLNLLRLRWLAMYEGAQVFSLDVGGGARVITEAVGGTFLRLSPDEKGELAFQPLRQIHVEAERVWASEFLLGLCEQEGIEINPRLREEVWNALLSLAGSGISEEHRTLTNFRHQVQDKAVRLALKPYCEGGPYGHLFDASEEESLTNSWIVFELEKLMNSRALPPAVACIFHRLGERFGARFVRADGTEGIRPTGVFADELWRYLDDASPVHGESRVTTGAFTKTLKALIKTGRKLQVGVAGATQSLVDASHEDHTVAAAFIDNFPTKIFLPNHAASDPRNVAAYTAMGVNPRQLEVIRQATPKRDYFYFSPLGQRLFQLDVGPAGVALCGGGSAEEQALVERVLQAKDPGEPFVDAYLRAVGVTIPERSVT